MAPPSPELEASEPSHRVWLGLPVAAGVLAALVYAFTSEPRGHQPLPAMAREALMVALPLWHTTEPVNEIVYGTRGFDTFGETFLLLAAIVGIGVITRGKEPRRGFIGEEKVAQKERQETDPHPPPSKAEASARQASEREEQGRGPATPDQEALGSEGPEQAQAMTVVVRGAARAGAPILVMVGLYLVAWGYSPGGGFPAGAVVLGAVLLAYVGYGYQKVHRVVRPEVIEPIEMLGALAIVVIEALGLVLKGSFAANWAPLGVQETIQSGGILQYFSGSELVEVASGLTLAVFGLLVMKNEWAEDEPATKGHGRKGPQDQP